jgi:hypothetical protein
MPYFVYVLRSESSGKIYIGQTEDLQNRLLQHNDPSCRLTLHTKRHPGPWRLCILRSSLVERPPWHVRRHSNRDRAVRGYIARFSSVSAVNPPEADCRFESYPPKAEAIFWLAAAASFRPPATRGTVARPRASLQVANAEGAGRKATALPAGGGRAPCQPPASSHQLPASSGDL